MMNSKTILFSSLLLSISCYAGGNLPVPIAKEQLYVGAFLTGAIGHAHQTTTLGSLTDNSYFTDQTDMNDIERMGSGSHHSHDWNGGIKVGNDWIRNQVILGVVMDYSGFSQNAKTVEDTATYVDGVDSYALHISAKTDKLFTLRMRGGFNVDAKKLIYVTGGVAHTQLKLTQSFTDTSLLSAQSDQHLRLDRIGWVAGGGLEYDVMPQLFLNLEYLFVDMPRSGINGRIENSQAGFGIPAYSRMDPFATLFSLQTHLVKLGLNYRV